MKILLIYHFFHPDTVISARLFSELAQCFVYAGHKVTVYTGNRLMRSPEKLHDFDDWNGVNIKRFSRLNFSQGSNFGRLFNSGILQMKWILSFLKERKLYDCVIIGTDPQFSYLMLPFLRFLNRKIRLIHWCFDLYPEAILVNSPIWMKILARQLRPFAALAYRTLDDLVDIGPCMRTRFAAYHLSCRICSIPPWALAESTVVSIPDPDIRQTLFGNARLGILYSGTVGHAHDLAPFISLARQCRRLGIDAAFCFAGYGNCYKEQTAYITPEDTNIRLAGFASEEELAKRLTAADIHMVSLRSGWEGIVVPSKFFGALAMGRPVLFSGPADSSVAQWIQLYHVGFLLDVSAAEELLKLSTGAISLQLMKEHALQCYQQHFSRSVAEKCWLELLKTF